MAGELVTRTAREGGGEIVPVDSEHSAVLQCITGRRPGELARLILTASGGPFRTWNPERVAGATVDEALRHPTWKMGKKITVDSASLVNKALEGIEAHFLFGLPEVAVELFLEGRIRFGRIAETIARVLETHQVRDAASLETVLAADADARRLAREAACS